MGRILAPTTDAGFKGQDGCLWIMSRTDEVINVARRRSRAPFTLALVAIGAAFLSPSSPQPSSALTSFPPGQTANNTAARGPSCPLPVGRQVKAVKAFLEMMPVFQHPRCFNCHGG